MKLYSITNWGDIYENNRTRDLKHMHWVPVPNNHDGDGYTLLVCRPNGAAILGSWLAILQVASKCETRGTLLRDGGIPHDAASISRMTRLPEKIIQEAIDICTNECKWLTCNESQYAAGKPHDAAGKPHDAAGKPHPTDEEQNGTEQNEVCTSSVFDAWNRTADESGLPKCLLISDARRRSLDARLKEPFFCDNWQAALKAAAESDFCKGDGNTGWRATFDWFIKPDSVAKLVEGKYSKPAEKTVGNQI